MTHGEDAETIVRTYHEAWTRKDFAAAVALLSPDLAVDTPVNDYPTTESFAGALTAFGTQATSVELLSAMSDGDEAMLLYDMAVPGIGTLRVAEHFRVAEGKIAAIRQVHDTVAIRAAGWA